MKFGAFFLLGSPKLLPAREMYERVLKWTVLAEDLGFDSVWFAEHHFSNYGYIPNPLLMAVKAAQITDGFVSVPRCWCSPSGTRCGSPRTSR